MKIDLPSSFGLFHANIASLNFHIGVLKLILSKRNGISEHKIRKYALPSNNIPGYDEFIFEPTETTHGGTGFYIKNNTDYISREDLQINSHGNFESIFIEIHFAKKRNLIVGCIYRHPGSDISIADFSNLHLSPTLQKISTENNQCVIMGDFNVDLLKINMHYQSNDFYNSLSSTFFTFILQPTRLHSKRLIDNIFFNSLEYQSVSGNLLIEISEGFITERSLPKTNLFKRDFRNFNEREFVETVLKMNKNELAEYL